MSRTPELDAKIRLLLILELCLSESMPLLRSLNLCADELEGEPAGRAARRAADSLRAGGSLVDAWAEEGELFALAELEAIHAGEQQGGLEGILMRLAGTPVFPTDGSPGAWFLEEFAAAMRAAESHLSVAVERLSRSATLGPFRVFVEELRGPFGSVALQMAQHPALFSPLVVELVRKAEINGDLTKTLGLCANATRDGLIGDPASRPGS